MLPRQFKYSPSAPSFLLPPFFLHPIHPNRATLSFHRFASSTFNHSRKLHIYGRARMKTRCPRLMIAISETKSFRGPRISIFVSLVLPHFLSRGDWPLFGIVVKKADALRTSPRSVRTNRADCRCFRGLIELLPRLIRTKRAASPTGVQTTLAFVSPEITMLTVADWQTCFKQTDVFLSSVLSFCPFALLSSLHFLPCHPFY